MSLSLWWLPLLPGPVNLTEHEVATNAFLVLVSGSRIVTMDAAHARKPSRGNDLQGGRGQEGAPASVEGVPKASDVGRVARLSDYIGSLVWIDAHVVELSTQKV